MSVRDAPEPRVCACRRGVVPTRWHCVCSRWKPSTQPLCDHCAAGEPEVLSAADEFVLLWVAEEAQR